MSRPRRSNKSREKLLDVGTQMLTDQGYSGTGLKEILDTVGVPKGSFYNYFKSKEFFVSEIISRYYQRVKPDLELMLERSDDCALQALRSFHSELFEKVLANGDTLGCPIGAMASEVGRNHELIHDTLSTSIVDWLGYYKLAISKGQKQGRIRSDISAEMLADAVWSYWQGEVVKFQICDDDNESLLRSFDTLLELLRPIKH